MEFPFFMGQKCKMNGTLLELPYIDILSSKFFFTQSYICNKVRT